LNARGKYSLMNVRYGLKRTNPALRSALRVHKTTPKQARGAKRKQITLNHIGSRGEKWMTGIKGRAGRLRACFLDDPSGRDW